MLHEEVFLRGAGGGGVEVGGGSGKEEKGRKDETEQKGCGNCGLCQTEILEN